MKSDLINRLIAQIPEMSKGQRAIGRFITESSDKAAYMTASRLGEIVGVSESTVVRFASSLGYAGYPELQDALRELNRVRLTALQRIEISDDKYGSDIIRSVLGSDIDRIKNTLEGVDRRSFADAVGYLTNAKRIYILGMRSAAALASFTAFYLRLMSDNVNLLMTTSGSELFEQLLRVSEGDVVLAITFPRYSKCVVNAVEYAKKHGATVIALTDSELSPVTAFTDCLLCAKSDMVSVVDSLTAPLSLINALIVAVSRGKRDELESIFTRLEDIWDTYDVYDKDAGTVDEF